MGQLPQLVLVVERVTAAVLPSGGEAIGEGAIGLRIRISQNVNYLKVL